MTDEERAAFQAHLDRATEIVSKWPEWKQNVLGKSMKAQSDKPREPVDNFKGERDDK